MFLLTFFAGVALLLALAGIYGVQSYSVARRTSEIGIRVALGAGGRAVMRQMMDQGMRPVFIGIGLGLGRALGLSRLMSGLLFGVEPSDPFTYVVVAFVVAVPAIALMFSACASRSSCRPGYRSPGGMIEGQSLMFTKPA